MDFKVFRFPKSENGNGEILEKKISEEKIARFKKVGEEILKALEQDIKIASLNPHENTGKKSANGGVVKEIKLKPEDMQKIDEILTNPIKEAIENSEIIPNLGTIIRDLSKNYPVWIASLDGIDLGEFDEPTKT